MDEAKYVKAPLKVLIGGKERLGHNPGEKRKVSIIETSPVVRNKQLVFKGQALGTKLYQLTMIFNGVDYSDKKDANHTLTVSLGHGDYCYMKQLSEDMHVQVRCTCPDFYFTWGWWDSRDKALAGPKLKPYVRKTTTHPPRNSEETPGLCKHLIEMVQVLHKLRVLK